MSRFFSEKYADLAPYVPGEQPRGKKYIKLNTNENPYPPLPEVTESVKRAAESLNLYSEIGCAELRTLLADILKVGPENLLMTNGSDEILNFAFMAFCDKHTPAVFADVTYGFYPVFAQINSVPYREIPLRDDLTINVNDYKHAAGTIFLANPNAPTAIALSRKEIIEVLEANPYNVVVVDEAYVDFGAESCVPLIREYDNLLVTQTFSKSRSMAGARLGYAVACEELIGDLNTVKFSTNPYNVNSMTNAAGVACLKRDPYNVTNSRAIVRTREWAAEQLKRLGFTLTDSSANFLFAKHPAIPGEELYLKLKERGILIRHFSAERIREYNRITVGTREDMEKLIAAITAIQEENDAKR